MNRQINLCDIFKLIFTFCIILHHVNWCGYYIFVEFYFIVTGFLLAKYQNTNPQITARNYTAKRLKKYYIPVTVSLIIYLILASFIKNSVYQVVLLWKNSMLEFLLLHTFGLVNSMASNGPAWYIAVMIWIGHIIYWLLQKHKDGYLNVIAPILVVTIYSHQYRIFGALNDVWSYSFSFLTSGTLRGLAGMSLGVLSYYFTQTELFNKFNQMKHKKFVLTVIVSCVLIGSYNHAYSENDFICVALFFLVAPLSINTPLKISNVRVVQRMIDFSLYIYLNHWIITYTLHPFLQNILTNTYCLYLVEFVLIFVISYIAKITTEKIQTIVFRKEEVIA